MSEKCKKINPFLFKNVKVLDFGAGKDLYIYNLVSKYNGKYIAVDNSVQVIDFFKDNNVSCYSDIDNIDESFDIIYMSSVFHEFISYLKKRNSKNNKKITKIIKKRWTFDNKRLENIIN